MSNDFRSRLIWSADVEREELLVFYLKQFPGLRAVKVDRLFVERFGFCPIEWLRSNGYRVFDDAKLIEIPSKVEALARHHLRARPWMLSCMAGAMSGSDPDSREVEALKRFAGACHEVGTLPCGVTVLTSKLPDAVSREFGGRTAIEQTLTYAEVLLEAGFTDLVCSSAELPAIRADARFDKLTLNVPGIRPSGSPADDQARAATPVGALIAGADRLIIGRPLTAGDPGLAYLALLGETSPYLAAVDVQANREFWRQRRLETQPPPKEIGNDYL